MPLSVTVTKRGEGVFVVSPVGSIDTSTYTELEEKVNPVLTPSTKAVVIDMKGVNYISSMGISVIFKIKKALEKTGGSFSMASLQPQIKKVFEIIKAVPLVNVFSSVDELDAYLNEIQRKVKSGEME
jgi:anti-anti-sigma factor